MSDKPIIFSAPMVRALLDGRKTQTRRVLKPQPHFSNVWRCEGSGVWWQSGHGEAGDDLIPLKYATGDRLWVREAWRPDPNGLLPDGSIDVFYPADRLLDNRTPAEGWRMPKQAQNGKVTPLHMPRWASRITLLVTDVRVQRVQEISEEDAIAEGCPAQTDDELAGMEARGWFADLWNSIHGPDAWDANPWVAAYTFTMEKIG